MHERLCNKSREFWGKKLLTINNVLGRATSDQITAPDWLWSELYNVVQGK